MDEALLPRVPGQPDAAATVCPGLPSGELPSPPGAARGDRAMVADHATGEAGEDRAKVTRHAKYLTFQFAEVVVRRKLFAAILDRIEQLALPPPDIHSRILA